MFLFYQIKNSRLLVDQGNRSQQSQLSELKNNFRDTIYLSTSLVDSSRYNFDFNATLNVYVAKHVTVVT